MFARFFHDATSPLIDGGDIYLRRPAVNDWKDWVALREKSRDFLAPWEPTWADDALSRFAFRRRVRRQIRDAQTDIAYTYLIFRKPDQVMLGGITLNDVRRGVAQTGSVGYWIGAPFARQGYMGKALHLLVQHAFTVLKLHRVEAACLPHNQASHALLASCGFREEGYARDYLRIDGRWQDHILFARLEHDSRT